MKVEWWYDDATFHYSDNTELPLARLTVRDDGTAQLLTAGEVFEFESETEASIWLLDEEYRRLQDLIEDLKEEGRPVDPRIQAPMAESKDELVRQMVIDLRPVSIPAANQASSPPAPGAGTVSQEHAT